MSRKNLKIIVASIAAGAIVLTIAYGVIRRAHTRHVFAHGKHTGKRVAKYPPLDTADYDRRLRILAHLSTATVAGVAPAPIPTATVIHSTAAPKQLYPKAGALLPFRRIVAFYGNFHSKQMGIVGEFPEDEVLKRLRSEVARWNLADPGTPVLPAIHYIAVTAQGSAGQDGKYRLRMSTAELERALRMARKTGGVAFFDIQLGKSGVEAEVPKLDAFLKLPDVHLGIDPEFAMKGDKIPGRQIGTMDAQEINWAIRHLSKLVEQYDLPPKVLIIHRFVPRMITNIRLIHVTPQVQVVIDMDGWGSPDDKRKAYERCIREDRIKLAGFKIFYKNDTRHGSRTMTPDEVLQLNPRPVYIQYQ
jgi:hypothetical protein